MNRVLRLVASLACSAFCAVTAAGQNQALSCSTNPQTGYIDLPASPLLTPANFTLEAWVRYDDASLPAGWVYPTIARKNFTQGVADWFLRVNANNNQARVLRFWANGAGGIVNVNWTFAAGAMTNWTHVAVTYDGSFATMYINGAQVAQSIATGPLVDTGDIARIGAGDVAPGSANERWNGLIEEVRIWSVARTAAEIAASRTQQITSAPGLVASYLLNGNGDDASPSNLDGTGQATPTYVTIPSLSGPTTYCTAGTTTNGCNASISASAQPSASQATPCTLSVSGVEGQKQGLLFYGLDNTGFTPLPWSATSTSFFCVKSPTQRTFPQNSGGVTNQCNGSFTVDLNNFFVVFPAAIGLPFSAGDKLYVQSWFRDPPAPRTTNLSNALEMTMQP